MKPSTFSNGEISYTPRDVLKSLPSLLEGKESLNGSERARQIKEFRVVAKEVMKMTGLSISRILRFFDKEIPEELRRERMINLLSQYHGDKPLEEYETEKLERSIIKLIQSSTIDSIEYFEGVNLKRAIQEIHLIHGEVNRGIEEKRKLIGTSQIPDVFNSVSSAGGIRDLIQISLDKKRGEEERFEALRQIKLIIDLANTKLKRVQSNEIDALSRFNAILRGLYVDQEGGEEVGTETNHLISYHDENGKTLTAELSDDAIRKSDEVEPPEGIEFMRVNKIEMHYAKVKSWKSDIEKIAKFHEGNRRKDIWADLMKQYARNIDHTEPHKDENGLKFIFGSKEEIIDTFSTLFDIIDRTVLEKIDEKIKLKTIQLQKKGDCEILDENERGKLEKEIETLEDRKKMKHFVRVEEEKDSLNGGFESGRKAGSSDLKIYKFKLYTTRADGNERIYEIQCYLPDGYADTLYRDGVKTEDYQRKRALDPDEGELDLFWSERIFKKSVNHEEIRGDSKSDTSKLDRIGQKQQGLERRVMGKFSIGPSTRPMDT